MIPVLATSGIAKEEKASSHPEWFAAVDRWPTTKDTDVLQGAVAERIQFGAASRAAQPIGKAVGLPVDRRHDTLSGGNG